MADHNSVTTVVTLTAKDIFQVRLGATMRMLWWFLIIIAGFILYSLVSSRTNDAQGWNLGIALAIPIVLAYVIFVSPYFAARAYLKKNPNAAGPVTYVFSETGIEISTPQSQSRVNWTVIGEARETSSQFVLYPQTVIAHVIPKRILSDPSDQATLRALIRANVKEFRLRG